MRAAVVLLEADRVAAIERRRDGTLYYLFPGGTVEPGETPEEAACREAEEELGVSVALERLVAEVWRDGNRQLHFLASIRGGEFGSGHGPEMVGDQGPAGTYRAVWLPLRTLEAFPLRPRTLAGLVRSAYQLGWPSEVLRVNDVTAPLPRASHQ